MQIQHIHFAVAQEVAFSNSSYFFRIFQGASLNSWVGKVIACISKQQCSTSSSSGFSYFLINDLQSNFKIDRNEGVITTATEINNEIGTVYNLVAIATSGGVSFSAPVLVEVSQQNKFSPQFITGLETVGITNIEKQNVKNRFVIRLHAFDNDSLIYGSSNYNAIIEFRLIWINYTTTSGNVQTLEDKTEWFVINSSSGEIFFNHVSLDLNTFFNTTIQAFNPSCSPPMTSNISLRFDVTSCEGQQKNIIHNNIIIFAIKELTATQCDYQLFQLLHKVTIVQQL